MISRFEGTDGAQRLREELARQTVVEYNQDVAAALAVAGELVAASRGDVLITQGGTDRHIDLILVGEVSVEIGGQEVARRKAGTHVGELTMVDPSVRRSATVRALTDTVVFRVPEGPFVRIADDHPRAWRALARDIGTRLRERERFVRPKNEKPHLFIGCSSEGLAIAREIQSALGHDPFVVRVWTDDVFQATHQPTEDLVLLAESQDFALLIATADDVTSSRGETSASPRDNVVFELGLFIGALGRARTLLLRPRGVDLKLPSDFFGLTALELADGDAASLPARVGPVATSVRKRVNDRGPR